MSGSIIYAYVSENPLSYTDPKGLCPVCVVPFIIGGVSALDVGATVAFLASGVALIDRMLSSGLEPGFLPADVGSAAWGQRKGIGAKAGKDLFHDIKKGNKKKPGSRAADVCTVNPDTGEILDGLGESIGNLNDGR